MSKIGIFMADGCEEIEGLTVVDIVRRAKMDITMISVNGKREVTSSHGVTFLADAVAEEVDYGALDGIVLPGGMRQRVRTPWLWTETSSQAAEWELQFRLRSRLFAILRMMRQWSTSRTGWYITWCSNKCLPESSMRRVLWGCCFPCIAPFSDK